MIRRFFASTVKSGGERYSLFQPTDAPQGPLYNDTQPETGIQLGMKFQTSVNGFVVGVRFYKQTGNDGVHTAQLHIRTGTNTGDLLASKIFSDETISGWQEMEFDSPIAITANTIYVIGYHGSLGHYSATAPYFDDAITNGPISSIQNSVSSNGVYQYSSNPVYPTTTFNAGNYWVDLVFQT